METDKNSEWTGVINAVLNHGSADPSVALLHESENTRVYKILEPRPYAVRISPQRSEEQSVRLEMLEAVGDLDGLVARILHSETREIHGVMHAIDVMTYVPGKALDHYPSCTESKEIVSAVYALHRRLQHISAYAVERGIPGLEDILRGLMAASEPSSMKCRAATLIESEDFSQLLATSEPCLIYGDPWPSNFLISHESHGPRVRMVDIEPLFLGPAILQPAVLFSACFVMSSLLFSAEDSEMMTLDTLFDLWPEKINPQVMRMSMRVFPIILSLFKVAESKSDPRGNSQTLAANLELLERCLAVIDAYNGA